MGTCRKLNKWTPKKAKPTSCVCPRCAAKHKKMMFWTGTLPARKFCPTCEQVAERDFDIESYSFGYMDRDELVSVE